MNLVALKDLLRRKNFKEPQKKIKKKKMTKTPALKRKKERSNQKGIAMWNSIYTIKSLKIARSNL